MTTIDQRILIPASPETIWQYISDIAQNPIWQADSTSISFLSSRREGPGVRWRSSTASHREYVLETTAWYDGLGYEYIFVDGADFREAKGRIRLQEIPEGTVVQWTLTYELGGLTAGLRNTFRVRRKLEKIMVESLRTLWRVVNESRDRQQDYKSKSLIREALDYEARAQYKARHPSNAANESELAYEEQDEHALFKPAGQPPAKPVESILVTKIPEPPVEEEDTRPSAAVTEQEQTPPLASPEPEPGVEAPTVETEPPINQYEDALPIEPLREPDGPLEMPRVIPEVIEETPKPDLLVEAPPPISVDDDHARFKPPPVPIMDEPPATPEIEAEPATQLEITEPAQARPAETPAIEKPSEELSEVTDKSTEPPIPVTEEEVSPQPADDDQPSTRESEEQIPEARKSTQESAKVVTDEVSIWEIFGVPKPSETQEIASVKLEQALPEIEAQPAETVSKAAIAPPNLPGLIGFRVKMRRKKVRLQRYR